MTQPASNQWEVVLTPQPPFDFELTAGYQTYFQEDSGTDLFSDGIYHRVIEIEGHPVLASVSSKGSVDSPALKLNISGGDLNDADLARAENIVTWMFALDDDLDGFYGLVEDDPLLALLTRTLRGLHPPRVPTVFESLVLAIAGQQISGKVARTLRNRLIQSHGSRLEAHGRTYFGFPSPVSLASAGVDGLRALGFSGRKSEYIVDISHSELSGDLELEGLREVSDEDVSERLIALRGVGDWTVHWVMNRALGRGNAFPGGDLALRRTLSRFYFNGESIDAAQANSFAERWGQYRAYVTCYLFAALRQGMDI
jgi:DNA-3-methyladenine glycosylase II